MALKDHVVSLVIRGKNLFSGTAAEAEDSLDSLGERTRELKSELNKLEDTQKIVKGFGDQRKAVAEAEQAYQQGTQAVAGMAKELRASEGAGEGLNRQWQQAKAAVAEHAAAIQQQRDALRESGKAQTQAERELKKLNTAYEKGRLDAADYAKSVATAQQRLSDAKRAHDDNRRALEQGTQARQRASAEVKRLGTAMREQSQHTKALAGQFDKAKTAAGKAKTEFAQQRAALEQSRRAISAMGGSTARLSQTQQRLTDRQRQLRAEMDKVRHAAAQQATSLKNVGDESAATESKLGSLARTAVGSVAAFFGLSTIAGQIKQMFTVGDQFERLESQLTGLMGSIEAGKNAADWIEEFARTTPLQLEQVTQTFVKLKAFGLDPMNGTMQAVVDQAYKLGGSFEEVEGIALALGQAWAKQKLQGEEILQLIERGVPVWDLLAEVTGKNTLELQKLSSEGKLGRDVIKALMDEMGEQSKGSAATGMTQLSGLISNAKDNLAAFYREVANSGSLDWLKQQITVLNAEFKAMSEDGRLKKLAQSISENLVKAGEAIKQAVVTVYEWRDAIFAVGKAWALLKIAGMVRDIGLFAGAMRTKLIARTAEASVKMGTAAASAGRLRMALMLIPGSFQAQAIIAGLGFIAVKGYEAAKSISELHRQVEAGNNAEAKQRTFWRETIKQNQAIMQSLQEYRHIQILTADEVARLNKTELAAYKKKLEQHKEYLGAQLLIKKSHEQLGNTALASSIKAEGGIRLMLEGMQALDDGIKLAAERIDSDAHPAIQALVNEFTQAVAEGAKADEVLRRLFKDTDLTATDQVNELVGTLMELKRASQISGDAISEYLGGSLQRLSTRELAEFKKTARDAFSAVSGGAEQSARVVEQVTAEAYRRLGISLAEIRTGIDDTGEQILGSFRLITADARSTGADITAAFNAALSRLDSEQELNALRESLLATGQSGRLAAGALETSLAVVDARISDVRLKTMGLGDGFDAAGDKVNALTSTLLNMAATGEFTAAEIERYLSGQLSKLSDEDLSRLKAAISSTFGDATMEAQQLAGVVDTVTAAAFERLGLSLQELRTGIDDTGQSVLSTFELIASSANASSDEIAAAFRAAAGRLDTEAELNALRESFVAAGRSGLVASETAARALAWLDEKIDVTKRKAAGIGDGFDTTADKAEASAARIAEALGEVRSDAERTRQSLDEMEGGGKKRRKDNTVNFSAGPIPTPGNPWSPRQAQAESRFNPQPQTSETITVKLEGHNGQTTDLRGSREQVDRLLALLKQQGMRTS